VQAGSGRCSKTRGTSSGTSTRGIVSREGALIGAGSSHIGVDDVGVFDLGPRHADLSGALRVVSAHSRVDESELRLLCDGEELEIFLFNYRECGLILKEEPPSP
jgi:hypothetical protein